MAGVVYVDGQKSDKPGTAIDRTAQITVKSNPNPYVSRGGLKLDKAIKVFQIDVNNLIAMDIGASTGGFTDCLLKHGCSKVYAVDVGYGQLDWSLRNDPRVVNFERTNIRYLESNRVPEKVDLITIDTSFISVTKFISKLMEFLKPGGNVMTLIKPQFEAGREKVGKKGVIREPEVHSEVITRVVRSFLAYGFQLVDLSYSPITGPEGNIEFLAYFVLSDISADADNSNDAELPTEPIKKIENVVAQAHSDNTLGAH